MTDVSENSIDITILDNSKVSVYYAEENDSKPNEKDGDE